jgi:hypothetical protein
MLIWIWTTVGICEKMICILSKSSKLWNHWKASKRCANMVFVRELRIALKPAWIQYWIRLVTLNQKINWVHGYFNWVFVHNKMIFNGYFIIFIGYFTQIHTLSGALVLTAIYVWKFSLLVYILSPNGICWAQIFSKNMKCLL